MRRRQRISAHCDYFLEFILKNLLSTNQKKNTRCQLVLFVHFLLGMAITQEISSRRFPPRNLHVMTGRHQSSIIQRNNCDFFVFVFRHQAKFFSHKNRTKLKQTCEPQTFSLYQHTTSKGGSREKWKIQSWLTAPVGEGFRSIRIQHHRC